MKLTIYPSRSIYLSSNYISVHVVSSTITRKVDKGADLGELSKILVILILLII